MTSIVKNNYRFIPYLRMLPYPEPSDQTATEATFTLSVARSYNINKHGSITLAAFFVARI